MIPNYKRPKYREYISDVLERPLTDEDLDMIEYIEKLEKSNLNGIECTIIIESLQLIMKTLNPPIAVVKSFQTIITKLKGKCD